MDALEAIRKRRSVRSYTHKPVVKEVIEQIIDAGRRAPSGVNQQPWEFIVVTDEKIKKQIASITDYGKFIAEAPVCIVVYCRTTGWLEIKSPTVQTSAVFSKYLRDISW